jgi:hypothetical protein
MHCLSARRAEDRNEAQLHYQAKGSSQFVAADLTCFVWGLIGHTQTIIARPPRKEGDSARFHHQISSRVGAWVSFDDLVAAAK